MARKKNRIKKITDRWMLSEAVFMNRMGDWEKAEKMIRRVAESVTRE